MAYSDLIDELTIGSDDTDYQYITNIEGDTMTGTVQDNKEAFDKYPNLIASKYNLMLSQFRNLISSVVSEQIVKTSMLNMFYPVGSYYETSDRNFNPNTAWGGTWVLETEGQVHVSAGTNYTVGATGGNKDAIIPSHNHAFSGAQVAGHTHSVSASTNSTGAHEHIVSGTIQGASAGTPSGTVTGGNHQHYASSSGLGTMAYVANSTAGKNGVAISSSANHYVFTTTVKDDLRWGGDKTSANIGNLSFTFSGNALGNHNHGFANGHAYSNGGHSHTVTVSESTAGGFTPSGTISTVGTSVTNANMQPYIVVNRWHRTA